MHKIQYTIYKCIDIKDWLCDGKTNGLSESIISFTRANALIHCPYVKDDDVLIVSAMDGETLVGYTAIFPEHLVRPDIWIATGTTLWVNPLYSDDFVGYNLVQRLWQSYPQCSVIGSDVAIPAAMIDKLLGATVIKYSRYIFVFDRTIRVHSLRNFVSCFLEPFRKFRQRKAIRGILATISPDIHVVVRDTIGLEAYDFICTHSHDNTFLRSCDMLNWVLRYPFFVENHLMNRVTKRNEFSDQITSFGNYLLQIYDKKNLVGIVMYGLRDCDMHIKMLYTDETHRESVYALIIETMLQSGAKCLFSIYSQLNTFIMSRHITLRYNMQPLLFTYPQGLKTFEPFVLQGIDGDMFA